MTLKKELRNISIVYASVALFIAVVSAVVAIVDGVNGWGITSHPILTFIFFACVGFSVLLLVAGIIRKYIWHIFCGACLALFVFVYAGFDVFNLKWWITLIVTFALIIIFVSLSVIIVGRKTEEIALNDHVEYKNYKELQAEKAEAELVKKEEPLPEIKTFK